mmetsp:Transcript_15468/g.36193  ORF Transcript_15468/g.36193 Transcript_15468/m.36193 type:complete len:86 (-) Transcript_15468:543-800(-)
MALVLENPTRLQQRRYSIVIVIHLSRRTGAPDLTQQLLGPAWRDFTRVIVDAPQRNCAARQLLLCWNWFLTRLEGLDLRLRLGLL